MATRKELINEYKQTRFRMGVFQIRNIVNGKIMLDSSPNLDVIWNRHQFELNFGSHRNRKLQEEWKTYGADKFVYEVLSELKQEEGAPSSDPQKELKALLELYMEELQPYGEKGYHEAR